MFIGTTEPTGNLITLFDLRFWPQKGAETRFNQSNLKMS